MDRIPSGVDLPHLPGVHVNTCEDPSMTLRAPLLPHAILVDRYPGSVARVDPMSAYFVSQFRIFTPNIWWYD
jgi:hypothetical protein